MKIASRTRFFLGMTACLTWLSACTTGEVKAVERSALEQAAAEATTIVERAQATAMVLNAKSTAAALISTASSQGETSIQKSIELEPSSTPNFAQPLQTADLTLPAPNLSATPLAESEAEASDKVEIISVTFAADGAYICVQYKAAPIVAQKWWQGMVSLLDETTGAVYDQIPVLPVIGPLIARPLQEGQLGYVMLVNEAPPLKSGATVTVKLGDYLFEHVPVQ